MALGGNRDRSGFVDKDKLMRIVKEEFGMTIKVDVINHPLYYQ